MSGGGGGVGMMSMHRHIRYYRLDNVRKVTNLQVFKVAGFQGCNLNQEVLNLAKSSTD